MLTNLVMASVAQRWGYSEEFMAWEPEALAIAPEHILHGVATVMEVESVAAGLYLLDGKTPEMKMLRLMTAPGFYGLGVGRRLWEHAVLTARDRGAATMILDADPNAEPFYLHMGAVTTGEHDWEPPMMPGWKLKAMRYEL